MLAGFEIRRRWRRVVVLTLLVGVVGAVVLSTVAGARRSESALAGFNASSRAANLELFVGDPTPAQLRAFRGVSECRVLRPRLNTPGIRFPDAPQLQAIAGAVDTRFGTVVDRPRIVAGRAADPTAVDEVTIGEALAAQLHLGVGDHLDGESYTPEQIAWFRSGGYAGQGPEGPRVRLRIVGIVRRPLDLGDRGAAGGVLVLTPAFNQKYETSIGSFSGTILRVRTRHGAADVSSVAAAARRIFDSPQFHVQDLAIESQGAQNAIDVLAVALWVFAGVAALAGLVAITIVLSREISLTAVDQATQSALGLTRPQRIAVGGFQALPVALGGAVLAVVGAAAASPLFPIGVAGARTRPRSAHRRDRARARDGRGRGRDPADRALLHSERREGAALSARLRDGRHRSWRPRPEPASRPSRRPACGWPSNRTRTHHRPGPLGDLRCRLRSPRGRRRLGVRVEPRSSRRHARAYGWTWDFAAVVDDPSVFAAGVHAPGLAAAAKVETANVQLDGRPVTAWGFTSLRGTIGPEIVAGRPPNGPDEIASAPRASTSWARRSATPSTAKAPTEATTTGSSDPPCSPNSIVPSHSRTAQRSPAPVTHARESHRHQQRVPLPRGSRRPPRPTRRRRTSSRCDLRRRTTLRTLGPRRSRPPPTSQLAPATLAALLAVLALLAVGHALVTSVRRRRRELAVLKTLGFDRHQIRGPVAWQATTLATVGLIVGIPAGLIVGNLVWRQVADSLGVSTTPAIPALALLLIIPCALGAVNLIAFFPAVPPPQRPAVALRSE